MQGSFWLIRNREEWSRFYRNLAEHCSTLLSDGPIFIKVSRYTHPRTLSQNDLFHGLCRDISEYWNLHNETQTSPDAIKRDLKLRFGVIISEYSPVTDARGARFKSTRDYTKSEMSDLITNTLAWAAERRIPLDDPREAA